MLTAITREVSPAIASCELTHLTRESVDYAEAVRQHGLYTQLLSELGCRVISLPADPELPDSVFVEDVALVFDEFALLTRPGAASRRAEVEAVAAALAPHRECQSIEAPGRLDGGDVLRIGRRVFVGQSARTNEAGIRQLSQKLVPFGYRVTPTRTRDCLHLKSAVTTIGKGRLLINREWVDAAEFDSWECIDIDPSEPFAANALRVGETLVLARHFPRTRRILEELGLSVRPVEASELAKAEGGVTCCSLLFESSVV